MVGHCEAIAGLAQGNVTQWVRHAYSVHKALIAGPDMNAGTVFYIEKSRGQP